MVNSYRRSDGPEGAHTCQKIFCHHSLYSGLTVSQAVWHIRWDTSLFLSSSLNKHAWASFTVDVGICDIITPTVLGLKVTQMGGRKVTLPSCATSLWNRSQNLHEAMVSHQRHRIRHLGVIWLWYTDMVSYVSIHGGHRDRLWVIWESDDFQGQTNRFC